MKANTKSPNTRKVFALVENICSQPEHWPGPDIAFLLSAHDVQRPEMDKVRALLKQDYHRKTSIRPNHVEILFSKKSG
jgi:hypothetical protein